MSSEICVQRYYNVNIKQTNALNYVGVKLKKYSEAQRKTNYFSFLCTFYNSLMFQVVSNHIIIFYYEIFQLNSHKSL